jgi:hypothetical protein
MNALTGASFYQVIVKTGAFNVGLLFSIRLIGGLSSSAKNNGVLFFPFVYSHAISGLGKVIIC